MTVWQLTRFTGRRLRLYDTFTEWFTSCGLLRHTRADRYDGVMRTNPAENDRNSTAGKYRVGVTEKWKKKVRWKQINAEFIFGSTLFFFFENRVECFEKPFLITAFVERVTMNRPRMGAGHRKERNAPRKPKPESRRESRVQQVNYSLSVGQRRRRKNTRLSRRFPRGRVSCLCFTIRRYPFLVLSTNFNAARTLWRNVILPTVEYRRCRTYAKLGLTDRIIRRVKTRRRLRVSHVARTVRN